MKNQENAIATIAYRRFACAAMLLATFLPAAFAQATNYPQKPIRLVVPYAPGGAVDIVARLLSDKLTSELGVSVFIDNRPGGDGSIGGQAVASAKPDGLTLLITVSSAHTLTPLLNKTAPDPVRAFEPIATVGKLGYLAVVRSDFPAKTFQEYVAYAKANSSKSSIGSSTSGIYLTSERLKRATGIGDVVIVSYKGPVLSALLSGEIDMTLDPYNSIAFIRDGKVRPLAVLSDQRNSEFPDVPTMEELGYKDIRYSSWMGVLAPAGTPPAIVNRLYAAFAKAMNSPDVLKRFREQHYTVMVNKPAEFAALIAKDTTDWKKLLATVPGMAK